MVFTPGSHGHRGRDGVPVLTYFDTPGYAEPIRMTFSVGNVHFVDRRIKSPEEFASKYQKYSPSGLVPILEVDGDVLCESQAIFLYAAKRAGLFPENPRDQDKAFTVLSVIIELYSVGATVPSSLPREQRYAKMRELSKVAGPKLFARIESLIEPSVNGWIVGDRLSFVDIAVNYLFAMSERMMEFPSATMSEQFPKMGKVYAAVNNHPSVIAYNKKATPTKPKLYYFNTEGLATSARWMFEIAGVEYEDIRVEHSEWPQIKPTIPGGVLPALDLGDGNWVTESIAIALHVARMTGFAPHRDADYAHAYSVLLTLAPLGIIARTVRYAESAEAGEAARKIAYEETLPTLFRRLEAVVSLRQSKQGYVVGDRLSVADIYVAYAGAMCMEGLAEMVPNMLTELPAVNKVTNLVLNHPAVKQARFRGVVCTPKLSYFPIPGRAEHIRQLFRYGKIDFVDNRVDGATWTNELKKQSITGVMPYLDIGDLRIYEILGCLQYIAERTNTLPRTWKGRSHSLAIFSVHANVHEVVLEHYAAPAGEQRVARVEELKPKYFTKLDIWEKIVAQYQSTEGYCVDHELSYIDFYVAYELSYNKDCGFLATGWEEKYPALSKTYRLVKALETTN